MPSWMSPFRGLPRRRRRAGSPRHPRRPGALSPRPGPARAPCGEWPAGTPVMIVEPFGRSVMVEVENAARRDARRPRRRSPDPHHLGRPSRVVSRPRSHDRVRPHAVLAFAALGHEEAEAAGDRRCRQCLRKQRDDDRDRDDAGEHVHPRHAPARRGLRRAPGYDGRSPGSTRGTQARSRTPQCAARPSGAVQHRTVRGRATRMSTAITASPGQRPAPRIVSKGSPAPTVRNTNVVTTSASVAAKIAHVALVLGVHREPQALHVADHEAGQERAEVAAAAGRVQGHVADRDHGEHGDRRRVAPDPGAVARDRGRQDHAGQRSRARC